MLTVTNVMTAVQDADLQCTYLLGTEVRLCGQLGLTEFQVVTVSDEVLAHLAASDGVEVAIFIGQRSDSSAKASRRGQVRAGCVTAVAIVTIGSNIAIFVLLQN